MAAPVFLAIDLGASSGRVVAARLDENRLTLDEVGRFENGPVRVRDSLFWDVLNLWQSIRAAMRAAADRYGPAVRSVGVDTWGVDFALLAADGALLANPHHYRDPRTDGVMEHVLRVVGRHEVFRQTGLQFLPFNTLFQLVALRQHRSPLLDVARRLLMMPDLFHWLLCGEATNERTNASTTQFYNPSTGDWAYDLLRRLDLPPALLGTIIEAGAPLGPLLPWVAEETGLPQAQVVAPATHDTASAVLAVPGDPSGDWCYISCGTWSLLGAELDRPVLTDRCLELNFTNEVGAGGTIRLLKNIAGMWLLQETRRCWAAAGRALGWQELNRLAASAPALTTLIDPDHPALLAPANMIDAIGQVCHSTGQSPPQSDGALVRCILESLALKYRYVLEALEQLLQRRISTIHLIGGGSQNRLLCQFAANACGRRVLAGPVEATAAGNGLVQAIACGTLSSVADARAVVRASFALDEFLPADRQRWDEAYGRFVSLVEAQRAS